MLPKLCRLKRLAAWSASSNTYEVVWKMGVARAPVVGSGALPAWMALVSKPYDRFSVKFPVTPPPLPLPLPLPMLLLLLLPLLLPPLPPATPTARRFDEITPELKPCQPNSPYKRENSTFGHLSITTAIPAASALTAAVGLMTENCIQMALSEEKDEAEASESASSVMAPAASELRKISTMSTCAATSAGRSLNEA